MTTAGGAARQPAREFIAGIGEADHCEMAAYHRPQPRRYVWHRVLPEVCGGASDRANLASCCDSCHYGVHDILWKIANGRALEEPVNRSQLACAQRGFRAAVAAGTQGKIPKEA